MSSGPCHVLRCIEATDLYVTLLNLSHNLEPYLWQCEQAWTESDNLVQDYKDSILPPDVEARVSIEAGSTFGWLRYVGFKGKAIGIDKFGASGPGPALYEDYGITTKAVVDAVQSLL